VSVTSTNNSLARCVAKPRNGLKAAMFNEVRFIRHVTVHRTLYTAPIGSGVVKVMTYRYWWAVILTFAFPGLVTVACGSSPSTPSAVQIAGTWTGTLKLSSYVGGECLEPGYAMLLGLEAPISFTISQTGSMVTARTDGCTWMGSATLSGFSATSTQSSCPAGVRRDLLCPDRGVIRDVIIVQGTLAGMVQGNGMAVTASQQSNVNVAGTATTVGTVTTTATGTMSRQ